MAYMTASQQQGRAGGWMQAGNLGGGGIGGGAGLWLAQHTAPWCAGTVLGIACAASCCALLRVVQPVGPIRCNLWRDADGHRKRCLVGFRAPGPACSR